MMRVRARLALLALLLALAPATSVRAQDAAESDGDHGVDQSAPPGAAGVTTPGISGSTELERRTSEIATQLRCPVCQGVSVEDSPTELARQMRATVREQLAAGRTPDQVRQYFVDRYGEWILLEPKARGFNLVVYILPWLAMLAGLAVIVLAVRRWTRPLPGQAPAEASPVATTIDS